MTHSTSSTPSNELLYLTDDVAIPRELFEAHQKGDLVLFVGAGASMSQPTGMPDFGRLAETLANKAGTSFLGENQDTDRLLGTLPTTFNIRRHTKTIFKREESRPNTVHDSIIQLANTSEKFKIITTNFDCLLEEIANSNPHTKTSWRFSDKPLTPEEHDFEGIVHIHGSAKGKESNIIITDEHFSRTYMSEGTARKFIEKILKTYHVLFVGYSYNDTMMHYLTRAIRSESTKQHYIFLSDSEIRAGRQWALLNLKPIEYPVLSRFSKRPDHSELPRALYMWARLASSSLNADSQEVQRLAETKPGLLSKPEQTFLLRKLSEEEGLNAFIETLKKKSDIRLEEWAMWVQSNSCLNKTSNIFGEPLNQETTITLLNELEYKKTGEGYLAGWRWALPRIHEDGPLSENTPAFRQELVIENENELAKHSFPRLINSSVESDSNPTPLKSTLLYEIAIKANYEEVAKYFREVYHDPSSSHQKKVESLLKRNLNSIAHILACFFPELNTTSNDNELKQKFDDVFRGDGAKVALLQLDKLYANYHFKDELDKIRFLCNIQKWRAESVAAGTRLCATTSDDSLSLNLEKLEEFSHLAGPTEMEQIKESLIRISYLNCSTSSERTSEASQKKWLIGLFNEWIEAVAKNDHLPLLDWRLFSEMLDSKNHVLRRAAAESLTREISVLNHCDPLFVEEVLLPHFLVQNHWSKNVDSFIEMILKMLEHLHKDSLALKSVLNLTVTMDDNNGTGNISMDFARKANTFLVGTIATPEKQDHKEKQWKGWIRGHVIDRLAGIPRDASEEELLLWADAAIKVKDVDPGSVRLFSDDPAAIILARAISDYLHDSSNSDTLETEWPWIKIYMSERLAGGISVEERSALADIVPRLQEHIKDGIELFDSNIPPLIRPFDERLISLIHLHPDNNDNIALCDFYIKRFKNTCSLTDKVDSLNLQALKDYFSLLLTSRGDKVEELSNLIPTYP